MRWADLCVGGAVGQERGELVVVAQHAGDVGDARVHAHPPDVCGPRGEESDVRICRLQDTSERACVRTYVPVAEAVPRAAVEGERNEGGGDDALDDVVVRVKMRDDFVLQVRQRREDQARDRNGQLAVDLGEL